jgi:hypothetical protein
MNHCYKYPETMTHSVALWQLGNEMLSGLSEPQHVK